MPEVLELAQVQMSQAGERQNPDPERDRLDVYRGNHELLASVELHREDVPTHATPESLLLGNLNHPRVRLRQPIHLMITREDSFILACIPHIEEFGYGSHVTAAVEDLRHTLIELFQTLQAEQSCLGPDMTRLLSQLHVMIEER